jgi:hypothetical protein
MKIYWLLPCMLLTTTTVLAHVNDRGMDYRAYRDRYGQLCCGVLDCTDDFVEIVIDGEPVVRLLLDGRWITIPGHYVVREPATAGRAHFCGTLHMPGPNTTEVKPEPYCVILPPRST